MLKAYFDESGLHSEKVFALAGYVAPEKEWQRLEDRWNALLQKPLHHEPNMRPERAEIIGRRLKCLHASDMEKLGKGRFRALGQRNRDYLKKRSVDIILTSGVIGIGSAVILPDYEALDNTIKEVIHEPYLLCFQYVVTEVARKARQFLGEDESEDIAYIFEQQPLWQERVTHLWNSAVAQNYKTKYRMGSITFGDKEKHPPLQAADRHAFEVYQHFSDPTPRQIWQKLMNSPQHTGKFFDKSGFSSLIDQLKQTGRL